MAKVGLFTDDIKDNKVVESVEEKKEDEPERKKLDPVVSEGAKVKKPSRFRDVFNPADGKDIFDHVIDNVIIPNLKTVIETVVVNSIHMALFGDTNVVITSGDKQHVSYDKRLGATDRNRLATRSNYDAPRRSADRGTYITFPSRSDAEAVLREMEEIIRAYGCITVLELYDLADIADSATTTDNHWGWTSAWYANIRRVFDGYLLELPAPQYIPNDFPRE